MDRVHAVARLIFICCALAVWGCYSDPAGSHPCDGCQECEECVEGPDGPRCAATPAASLQCAANGNIHSYDSCDADEGISTECPLNSECIQPSDTEPECVCTTNWEGKNCDTCPDNWDAAQDCAVCANNWLGDECEFGCDAAQHQLCQAVVSGGATYYCTLQSGGWQWRTSPACDDGDPCTHNDTCWENTCQGTAITCTDTVCLTRTCNGTSTCTETPKSPETECGATACSDDDYCEEGAFWAYPETCTRYCSGTGDVCEECACEPSATICQTGPTNECCTATCNSSTGCMTVAGPCADICGTTTLKTNRNCTGCSDALANGTCGPGDWTLCQSSASACNGLSCGGETYQCRLSGSTWGWTSEPCPDGFVCSSGECMADWCFGDGVWYDPASDLCWQNPATTTMITWPNSVSYCNNLVLGGYSDWRLPNIDELITLLRGCQDGTNTYDQSPSLCTMTPAGCAATGVCGFYSNCHSCTVVGCGCPGNCYRVSSLSGTCYGYWSSTSHLNNPTSLAWVVLFTSGTAATFGKTTSRDVRCVRDKP